MNIAVIADIHGNDQALVTCLEYLKDKEFMKNVLNEGAEKAAYVARKTLSKVMRKIGFYDPNKS